MTLPVPIECYHVAILTEKVLRKIPPITLSFYLHLYAAGCGWNAGIWATRTCSFKFLPDEFPFALGFLLSERDRTNLTACTVLRNKSFDALKRVTCRDCVLSVFHSNLHQAGYYTCLGLQVICNPTPSFSCAFANPEVVSARQIAATKFNSFNVLPLRFCPGIAIMPILTVSTNKAVVFPRPDAPRSGRARPDPDQKSAFDKTGGRALRTRAFRLLRPQKLSRSYCKTAYGPWSDPALISLCRMEKGPPEGGPCYLLPSCSRDIRPLVGLRCGYPVATITAQL